MTKDEMKNRISMALKDPMLQQGFEIICKNLSELENEVAILTNENKILKQGKTNVFAELNDETARSNEMLMDKVADLEKENAELKEEVKNNEDLATIAYMQGAESQKKKAQKQFAKAKEIIKKLKALYLYPVVTKDDVKRQDEILNEAERFLNSEVEK